MPDVINGIFETCGGFFILLSVIKLYRDKQVRGVSWLHAGFFTAWGWWNIYFYAAVDLWWSWAGGIGLVLVNTFWLGQLVYYMRRERHEYDSR